MNTLGTPPMHVLSERRGRWRDESRRPARRPNASQGLNGVGALHGAHGVELEGVVMKGQRGQHDRDLVLVPKRQPCLRSSSWSRSRGPSCSADTGGPGGSATSPSCPRQRDNMLELFGIENLSLSPTRADGFADEFYHAEDFFSVYVLCGSYVHSRNRVCDEE